MPRSCDIGYDIPKGRVKTIPLSTNAILARKEMLKIKNKIIFVRRRYKMIKEMQKFIVSMNIFLNEKNQELIQSEKILADFKDLVQFKQDNSFTQFIAGFENESIEETKSSQNIS